MLATSALASDEKKQCVRIYAISGFSNIDKYHVLLNGRTGGEKFLVGFKNACRDINFVQNIQTSFENKRVCVPGLESVRTDTAYCRVETLDPVSSEDEAKAIAAEHAAQREARKAAKDGS